jgi:hypothetical protein
LKQVFPEHEVLVKVPVIRFLSGSTGDLKAMIQIKDIYCSFTICSPKGRVLGCIDIPGAQGLKASRRDLKKKLFDSFGLPYAVLGPKDLPTQEALRALFLNETLPQLPIASQFEASHLSQVSDYPAQVEMPDFTKMPESIPEPMKVSIPVQVQASIPVPVPVSVSLDPVGDVRHNLHIKLEGNRKRRLAAMESLKASAGVVEDTTAPGSGSRWDDSFIMGEGPAHSVH